MKNIFWIVAGFILASVLLTRMCTPAKVTIKETVVTKSDTVWLKPDTVVNEVVVTEYKTIVKTRSVPTPVEVQDTNLYVYETANFFGDTIAVLDTISIVDNKIVDHKQRVVLMDVQTTVEKVIEVPVVITDTITVTKEITKELPAAFSPSPHAGLTYLNYGNEMGIAPNMGYSFGRHYIGIGAIVTFNKGLNGGLFEYKFRFKK